MDISMRSVIAMLALIGAKEDNEVVSNVLIVAESIEDERVQREVVQAVADGLGVSLV